MVFMFFFYAYYLFVEVLTKFLKHPYNSFLKTLYLVNCLSPFHLALFLGISFVLSRGILSPSLIASLCLLVCIRQICYDSKIGRVALCRTCPVEPTGAVSLIT